MNFYRRRPLALAISICLLASAAAAFLPGTVKIALIAAAVLGICAAGVILRRKLGFIPKAYPYAVVASVITVECLITSYAYYDIHAERHIKLGSGSITATVTDVFAEYDFASTYVIRLHSVNGENYGGKGVMLSESMLSLDVGDIITAEVKFGPLSDYFDYHSGAERTALADGYLFTCRVDGGAEIIGEDRGPTVFFSRFREKISAAMNLYLGRAESAMADALFLGERDGLGVVERDFRYLGITHILALSGLHIAMLSGTLDKALTGLRVGKRIRCLTVAAALIFYVALTGFLMSALRAAIMVLIALLASAFGRTNDSITALFAAVYLIVLAAPAAIWDVSLQLSFAATLGVILMAEAAEKKYAAVGKGGKRLGGFVGGVGASLGAVLFILPFQWLYFGEVALMSVPATVVVSVICEGMLVLYLPYALFSLLGLHYCAATLAGVITLINRLCTEVTEALAEFSQLVSLRYPFAFPILILLTAAIVIMMVKDVGSWLWALLPFSAAVSAFALCMFIHGLATDGEVYLNYVNSGKSDAFVAVSDGHAVVIDFTLGSSDVSYSVISLAEAEYATEIDTYVLTDVSVKHINALRTLMRDRRVGRILAPIGTDDGDMYIIDQLSSAAHEHGAELVLYKRTEETVIGIGNAKLTLPKHTELKRSSRPLAAMKLECGEQTVTYIGAAVWENGDVWEFVTDADVMIIGWNGPTVRAVPQGVIPENVDTVYFPSDEAAKELEALLSDFEGDVYIGNPIRTVLEG